MKSLKSVLMTWPDVLLVREIEPTFLAACAK